MSNVCPACKKDDAIQKLSAIVSGGHVTGTFYERSGSTLSGNTISELARLLAPPAPPRELMSRSCFGVVLLFLLISLISGCFGYVFVFSLICLTTGCESEEIWAHFAGIISAIISAGVVVYVYNLRDRRVYEEMKRKDEVRYKRERSIWDAKMEQWERLYYCFRDDVVFDSKTGDSCHPRDLQEFLNMAV